MSVPHGKALGGRSSSSALKGEATRLVGGWGQAHDHGEELALIAAGYAVSACVGVAAVAINELRLRRSLRSDVWTGGLPHSLSIGGCRAPRQQAIGRLTAGQPAGVLFRRIAGSGDDGAGAGAVGGVERRELRGRRARQPDRDGTSSVVLSFIHWRSRRRAPRRTPPPRHRRGAGRAELRGRCSMAAGCCAQRHWAAQVKPPSALCRRH